jgi:Tol biopolymer transport system component
MQLPRTPFTFLKMMTVVAVALAGCFAAGGSEVEHGNVSIAVSPDGQRIAFSAADGDLYLLSLDTRRVSRLTKTDVTESSPSFSPDGNALVYAATVEGRNGSCIFFRSLDGKQVRQLTNDADRSDAAPRFSPDGMQIAFTRAYRHRPYSMGGWTWDQYDVCIMSRDGTNVRCVTSHKYYQANSPCFIDGGKMLVFSADGDYPDTLTSLLSVPADGSQKPTLLTTVPPGKAKFAVWGSDPSVSIDGKLITFISDRMAPFKYDLYVMTRAGGAARPLGMTTVSRYNQQPGFLPDGKNIIFLAGTEMNASSRYIFSLWKVGLDGSKPSRIAESRLFTDPLHWPAPSDQVQPTGQPLKP